MPEIKTKYFPDGEEIVVNEASITYMQNNEVTNGVDALKLSILTQGAGFYFVMQTERWAFDDIDELIKVLTDFKTKAKF